MASNSDWSEVEALKATLGKAQVRVPFQALRLHRSASFALQREMMVNAPVDTGNLMNSVTVEFAGNFRSGGGIESSVGPEAEYGAYVNNGTSRTPPQPFATDAANTIRPAYIAAVAALGNPFGEGVMSGGGSFA